VARAVVANLGGGVPQGASTLTQQVARTMFLSTRRTLERKLKEALIARRLEVALTKDQILKLYLNQVYVGTRAYGMGAAAETYFDKPLAQLNLAELALIAGLPQNPIYANPSSNEAAAVRRQRWVLQRMLRTGKISQAEHDAAVAAPLAYRRTRGPDVAAQYVAEMARRAVFEQLGEKAHTEGIRVFTSIRAEEQRAAQAALRKALIAHERRQPWRGPEDQESLPAEPDGADVTVDPATGRVRALVGGFSFSRGRAQGGRRPDRRAAGAAARHCRPGGPAGGALAGGRCGHGAARHRARPGHRPPRTPA
jgi:penicillin-binding protein 1A